MDEATRQRNKAVGLLFMAAVIWSSSGLLIKLIDWNPMAISGTRSAISAVVLLAYLCRVNFKWSTAQMGGAVAYAATVTLFVTATKLTTAANAILLQYTSPIYVALLSAWFLGERVTRLDWLTIAVVLSGMVLFFLDHLTGKGLLGNFCAILGGISVAWFTLFMRKQRNESPLEMVILGNVIAALIGVPFMLESLPGPSSWMALVLLGVFQLSVPYILFSMAIKHVTALDAILIPAVETILNPIWVLLLIGERPGNWALFGGIIVMVSITSRGLSITRGNKVAHTYQETLSR